MYVDDVDTSFSTLAIMIAVVVPLPPQKKVFQVGNKWLNCFRSCMRIYVSLNSSFHQSQFIQKNRTIRIDAPRELYYIFVSFVLHQAFCSEQQGSFDLVTSFSCLHWVPNQVIPEKTPFEKSRFSSIKGGPRDNNTYLTYEPHKAMPIFFFFCRKKFPFEYIS